MSAPSHHVTALSHDDLFFRNITVWTLKKIKINPVRHSMLESDLENHQAQLSRFQLHVTSVTEDIVSMESMLNSTIMTLKKTLVSATCA